MEIIEKERCTGCEACASVCPQKCITMNADDFGFLHPSVDEDRCIQCNLCKLTCPASRPPEKRELKVYAAYDKNGDSRMRASSGGVFGLLAGEVLRNRGVVFGAAYDETFAVYHTAAASAQDLDRLKRAKYSQSRIDHAYQIAKEHLDAGREVLFSGTPCQIAGLKAYLRKDYDSLLAVDLICMAVPSPKAWRSYLQYRKDTDRQDDLPVAINQRDKTSGWSRYQYSIKMKYASGYEYSAKSGEDPYMLAMTQGLITRTSCTNCAFRGEQSKADITLGDFWGIWNQQPEMDDNKGTSAVIIHTEKGERALYAIMPKANIMPMRMEQLSAENIRAEHSPARNENRDSFLQTLTWNSIPSQQNQTHQKRNAARKVLARIKRIIKNP